MKKYEFVNGDTKVAANGAILRRIRAVVDIDALGVAAGDLGGYIEGEKNLSHSCGAWVSDDAQVYGAARVSGNAHVSGNARVSDDGLIFWASKVGTENGTLTAYLTNNGEIEITRGCFRGSVDEFLLASESKHDDDTHIEYRLLIEVAVSRITRAAKSLSLG